MTKQTCLGVALVGLLLSSAPVLAEGETAATVVAEVNGTQITLGQMVALRENLPEQYLGLPDDLLYKGILDQLVQQEVLAQSVKEQTTRDKANLENDKRAYLSGVVIKGVAETAVTDEALQKAYDARYKDVAPGKEYNAAHILVQTEEEAKAIKAELDGGADFAEIARTKSLDTGSGAAGGELGWFGLGMMVKPFEDAVIAATPGKVTEPVQSDFGWHLVLVKESRDAKNPTLDEIREDLAAEVESAAVEAKIKELVDAAKVAKPGETLDPALIKNTTLID